MTVVSTAMIVSSLCSYHIHIQVSFFLFFFFLQKKWFAGFGVRSHTKQHIFLQVKYTSFSLRDSAERGNDTLAIAVMFLPKAKDFRNETFQICGLCVSNYSLCPKHWENMMANKLNLNRLLARWMVHYYPGSAAWFETLVCSCYCYQSISKHLAHDTTPSLSFSMSSEVHTYTSTLQSIRADYEKYQ